MFPIFTHDLSCHGGMVEGIPLNSPLNVCGIAWLELVSPPYRKAPQGQPGSLCIGSVQNLMHLVKKDS